MTQVFSGTSGALAVGAGTVGATQVVDGSITGSKLASGLVLPTMGAVPIDASVRPIVSAYQVSTQSIANNTMTKIQYDGLEPNFNPMSLWSGGTMVSNTDTTNRFTPNIQGVYHIMASVGYSATAAEAYMTLYKNNAAYKRCNDVSATNNWCSNVSCYVYFNGTTDYVDVRFIQVSGVAKSTAADMVTTYFQAALISRSA